MEKQMAITKLKTHDNCTVEVSRTKKSHEHYAELRCKTCNKHVQWIGAQQYARIKEVCDAN